MTSGEIATALEAIDTLEARGELGGMRLRQIIRDDALGCERHRREYAAPMLRMADASRSLPVFPDQIELTVEDRARTRADEFECTCSLGGCRNGSCGVTPAG